MKKGRNKQSGDEERPESEASDDDSIIDVYPFTDKNDLCMLFADDEIACGGGVVGKDGDGFGILLEEDLLSGSSSPCATYDNPSLCAQSPSSGSSVSSNTSSDGNQFEVANIEVWSFTPFMFVADAERSEQSLQFIKNNSAGSVGNVGPDGGDNPFSASAWSNFI